MTRPPSSMDVTTRCPCDKMKHVNSNLAGAIFGVIPCARSSPFPTAALIQYEVGNSHPAYILWKYLIAAKYPLTVDS